jgi:DNA-binding transcriptional LysR family regulator
MMEALETQDVDFALSGVPARAEGILAEHLCRYPAVCVVRPDHVFASAARVSLVSIARERFISLGEDDESQAAISHAFRKQHIEIMCPVEVSLCSSACAWVATAGGCAIVDPFTAGEWNGQLLRVETEPVIWFDIWLLRSETKPFTRVASLFLDSLRVHLISMPRAARC